MAQGKFTCRLKGQAEGDAVVVSAMYPWVAAERFCREADLRGSPPFPAVRSVLVYVGEGWRTYAVRATATYRALEDPNGG